MPAEPAVVPYIEVREIDLEQAKSQITDLQAALDEEQSELDVLLDAETQDPIEIGISQGLVDRYANSILEIKAEARGYYYALHNVPRPELCTLCNYTPTDKNSNLKECPNCFGPFKNQTVDPKGSFNWRCRKADRSVFCITTPTNEEPDIPEEDVI